MMVPRSYLYASAPSMSEIHQGKGLATKAPKERGVSKRPERKSVSNRPGLQPDVMSPSPAIPSKPVVIPTRTKSSAKRAIREPGEPTEKRSSASSTLHDSASMPPSTAAFLAMTSIPEQGRRMVTGSRPRPIERTSRCVREHEVPKRSLSSSNPQTWDFLLSPPEEDELQSCSFSSNTTLAPLSSVRSISTESMPSLAEDGDSISSMSNPATPGFAGNGRLERRKQSLSTSAGEDCLLDHPLMPPAKKVVPAETETTTPIPSRPGHSSGYRASFKSNLTASFRAIRSAARSISEFTGPLPQRDDLLSRSVLSMDIPFTDEIRPRPSVDPPDPALRRYLNPITLSPVELHFHGGEEQLFCKASIQLQTYQPGTRQSSNASSPPIFVSSRQDRRRSRLSKNSLDTEDAFTSSLVPTRQREPRENCDFLRVIVLEMNMRKVGKLSDSSPGRARLWLPAREGKKPLATDKAESESNETQDGVKLDTNVRRVPKRWAGEET